MIKKDSALLLEVDAKGVATLTLNRPEIHNAFDEVLIDEMIQHLNRLDVDPGVRVVVLSAKGKSFSAGADLNWMRRMSGYSEAENLSDAKKLASLMATLNGLSKPTIAVVQGNAFGGGVGLVACCDIAIAVDSVKFCFSEVKLGLIPAVISPYIIAAIGARMARRYFLTAERFDAKCALEIALVHMVVDVAQLQSCLSGIVTDLLAAAPIAQAESKLLIELVANSPIDSALIDETAERIAKIRISKEGKKGIQAFLNKKPPDW